MLETDNLGWKDSKKTSSVQHTGGCAVQWGMSVHCGDIMSTVEDIMSTLGVFSTLGGYHEYTGGYNEYTRGYHDKCGKVLGKTTEFVWKPQCIEHPCCTHHILPHSSWYIPLYSMISSSVLNIHPQVYCTPPVVLQRQLCRVILLLAAYMLFQFNRCQIVKSNR